ncbi:unnamed protein product [Rhizophagus irregularis]|nr:unnamed protein product [Rhizophagus irregularis]CAB4431489.1 unnamed protein product [Rhizophagus irregularis]
MGEFSRDVKELAKKYIWNVKCEEVNRWERCKGITNNIKRMGNKNCSLISRYGNNERVKQKFAREALDRWIKLGVICRVAPGMIK